jgi:hypothetical protein
MRDGRRWAVAGAAAGLLSLTLCASSAFADVGGRSLTLAPVEEGSKPGDTTSQAVPSGRSYKCTQAGTLRRKWQSYVIGWCTVGMHIDISSSDVQGWQAGWGEGNFQHCGWFQSSTHPLVQEGLYDHNCGTNRYPESYFATAVNVAPTNDGDQVPVYGGCTRYLNVKPWSSSSTTGTDSVGTLLSTDRFFWRYRTKNNKWVLGRVERPGQSVYYDWVFVPTSCVGTPPTRAPETTVS